MVNPVHFLIQRCGPGSVFGQVGAGLVRMKELEPPRPKSPEPKSSATNFTHPHDPKSDCRSLTVVVTVAIDCDTVFARTNPSRQGRIASALMQSDMRPCIEVSRPDPKW